MIIKLFQLFTPYTPDFYHKMLIFLSNMIKESAFFLMQLFIQFLWSL